MTCSVKVEEQSLLCGEVITIVDLSPQTHVDGWWRGNQPDNMGCLEWKRWYHWSLVMGCLTQANFSILPVNDRFVLPFIAHACSDHLIVVVTWESHDLIMYTCLQIWWRSGNAGYGRVFVVVQDQDHNQFILSDEFGSSHTNIGVLRS